jgi:hypothetical protein
VNVLAGKRYWFIATVAFRNQAVTPTQGSCVIKTPAEDVALAPSQAATIPPAEPEWTDGYADMTLTGTWSVTQDSHVSL